MDGEWMVKPSSVVTRAERQNDLITNFLSLTVRLLRTFSRETQACRLV